MPVVCIIVYLIDIFYACFIFLSYKMSYVDDVITMCILDFPLCILISVK